MALASLTPDFYPSLERSSYIPSLSCGPLLRLDVAGAKKVPGAVLPAYSDGLLAIKSADRAPGLSSALPFVIVKNSLR